MSQLDDRLHNAANGLRAATAGLPVPPAPVQPHRRHRAFASVLATAVVVTAVVIVGLLVLVDDRSHVATQPSSSRPQAPHARQASLLPAGLTLPSGWNVVRSTSLSAVIRGSGAVSRVVVWQPRVVVSPETGQLVPAPYAIAGFFFGHPDLRVVSAAGTHLGARLMDGADVRVAASAARCGAARCVPLTRGPDQLRLRRGHAVRAYFGTAYAYPLVVLVESATGSLSEALAAARPVLAELR